MNAHALLEALPHGILSTDSTGRVVCTNGAARRLLGVPPMDGLELAARAHESDRAEMRALWARCLFERRSARADLRFGGEHGERWLTLELLPVEDDLAHGGGLIAVVRDATATRAELDLLCAARDAAERQCAMAYANAAVSRAVADEACAATQARSEFLACLSDELRTPLSAMLSLVDTALAGASESSHTMCLRGLRRGVTRVLSIVDDVLDLSALEAGLLSLSHRPFQLEACVLSAAESALAEAESPVHTVRCSIDSDVPALVMGDPGRVRQLVGALTRQLITASLPGEVTLHARRGLAPASFRVALQEESVAIHFELRGPAPEGHGARPDPLGERLWRSLVEHMSGEPLVAKAGEGWSGWRFGLCVGTADVAANDTPLAARELAGVRALVVSTDPMELVRMLEALGGTAFAVTDVIGARTALENAVFGVVVVEERLFEDHGLDAAAAIRRESGLPVLLLTASGRRGDGARCRDTGIGAYLPKPFSPEELAQALASLLEAAKGRGPHVGPITRHSMREQGALLEQPRAPSTLDREALLDRLGGDEELMHEMAALMLAQLEKMVLAIDAAAGALDAQGLFRASHSLKGAAANLAATGTAEAAHRLENLGREGRLAEVPEAHARLREEVARLRPALAALAA